MRIIIIDTSDQFVRKIDRKIDTILERTARMATQSDLEAAVTQLAAFLASISTSLVGIRADLDQLATANGLDLTTLTDRLGELATVVDQAAEIDALNPVVPLPAEQPVV